MFLFSVVGYLQNGDTVMVYIGAYSYPNLRLHAIICIGKWNTKLHFLTAHKMKWTNLFGVIDIAFTLDHTSWSITLITLYLRLFHSFQSQPLLSLTTGMLMLLCILSHGVV